MNKMNKIRKFQMFISSLIINCQNNFKIPSCLKNDNKHK